MSGPGIPPRKSIPRPGDGSALCSCGFPGHIYPHLAPEYHGLSLSEISACSRLGIAPAPSGADSWTSLSFSLPCSASSLILRPVVELKQANSPVSLCVRLTLMPRIIQWDDVNHRLLILSLILLASCAGTHSCRALANGVANFVGMPRLLFDLSTESINPFPGFVKGFYDTKV